VQQHVEAPVTLPLAELLEPILDDAMFEANQNGKQLRLPSLPAESLTMWPELLARALEIPAQRPQVCPRVHQGGLVSGGTGMGDDHPG
jgi:hypothetical protein